jgi:DNA-binding NtrC family response regulator
VDAIRTRRTASGSVVVFRHGDFLDGVPSAIATFGAGGRCVWTMQDCILIVEADIRIRHPLARYLRGCGYAVVEAADAEEARALLSQGKAVINIVLADANPSGDSGFVLAHWIRQNHPQVKVILAGTVAKAAEKAGDLCEDGPAVSRPYDHKSVLDEIRRSLAQRGRNNPTN